jgi:hypothetical protein
VIAEARTDEVEVYGESEARTVYTATLPATAPRAIGVARSELRLEHDAPTVSVAELLPKPVAAPAGIEIAAMPFTWAAALAGASPWLSLDGNLLPLDRRRSSSRVRLVPTFALAAALAVLLILLAVQSRWADTRYLGVLQHEIRRFEPAARRVESLDKDTTTARARSQALDDFRRRTRLDLDTLAETTKLIPPPGWVANLDMDRTTLQIGGEIDQAAPLLERFDKSPLFERSEFTMPITRSQTGELFRIRSTRQTPPAGAVK